MIVLESALITTHGSSVACVGIVNQSEVKVRFSFLFRRAGFVKVFLEKLIEKLSWSLSGCLACYF